MKRFFKKDGPMNFVLPVICEYAFTTAVSLVYSSVTGAISASALAASATVNQAISFINALFSLVMTGSAILTANLVGRREEAGASRTVEQSLLMAPVLSVSLSVVLFLLCRPVCRLLLPGADELFLSEGMTFYRISMVSVPALIISNTETGILRAAGSSRPCLISTVAGNLVQVAALWLFTTKMKMGIAGVGWAAVACRVTSMLVATVAILRSHRGFRVEWKRVLKPDFQAIRRILRLGAFTSVDAAGVQLGYVIINSLLVSLGTVEAGVHSELNAIITFTGICQSIASVTVTTLVGQRIGMGDIPGARRTTARIFLYTQIATLLLCLPTMLFPTFTAGLFTKDAAILRGSADFMWIMFPYCFLAVGVNVYEPAVKAAGETKFTMILVTACIWCLRLPLTLLFCLKWHWGVPGVFAANMTSHTVRLLSDYFRVRGRKWGTKII